MQEFDKWWHLKPLEQEKTNGKELKMNTFYEVLAILLLFFLFIGEPDVWDSVRKRAFQETSVKTQQKKTSSANFTHYENGCFNAKLHNKFILRCA